jgi:transcriptional regulator of acetoin/glycerol metabolism
VSKIEPQNLYFHSQVRETAAPAGVEVSDAAIPLNLEQAEVWLLRRAIARTGGNISEAARLLGTNRTRIYRALAQEEQ